MRPGVKEAGDLPRYKILYEGTNPNTLEKLSLSFKSIEDFTFLSSYRNLVAYWLLRKKSIYQATV